MPTTLYSADVVCPMSGPPVADGGVLVAGATITAVGDAARLRPQASREHHVVGVLLPGLVNGATSLELTDAAPLAASGPFAAWLDAVAGLTATWPAEQWGRSAHRGVLESLRSGTTAVFDTVTRGPGVPAAVRAGLAGDSFVEVADVDASDADAVLDQVDTALTLPAGGRRVGIAPAGPSRLGTGVLQSLGALAKRTAAPVQIRAAGSEPEELALREGQGPLADRARSRGLHFEWLGGGAPTPVRFLEALGMLQDQTSLVHPVRVDAGEARLLARRGVAVVFCPRAGERLQMGFGPLEHFVDSAVPVALGTDSRAIVPDVDMLAEGAAWVAGAQQRGLHLWPTRAGPVGLHEAAVRLVTLDGARALGWGSSCGVLEPGRRADLVGIDIDTNDTDVFRDLVDGGAARQVLTVLGGIRVARRESADRPWPPIDNDRRRTHDNA